jgi:alanyl-tRNA synthetase
MTAKELRQKYLDFFKEKGHVIIPSASLIPENDPTTLFTGSGMQPMVPYLLGEKHPLGTRIADSQKSFRTVDMDEVGDNRHTTLFEMLGNWSLGDYFKKEQIEWMFEFLTKALNLDPKRIYVSVFRGNEELGIPRDDEAVRVWRENFERAGIEAEAVDFAEENGMQGGRIFYYDETKNWWSRAGVPDNMPIGEPGGPDSEMFWDFGEHLKLHENSAWKDQPCHINCDCGRFLEIGNNVFMEYVKTEKGFEFLKQKNVDYGGGLERQVAAVQDAPDIFLTDIFSAPIKVLENLSAKEYAGNEEAFRVILDHLRAATFLISDGAHPSNKDQGYFTRRLIRRAVRFAHKLGIENNFCGEIAKAYIEYYKDPYVNLEKGSAEILRELEKEENKFRETLDTGLKLLEKFIARTGDSFFAKNSDDTFLMRDNKYKDLAEVVFNLYQTHGFPLELTIEELGLRGISSIDENKLREFFNKNSVKHQELSRAGAEQKFKGGLADQSELTKRLHTATHLLNAALRKVLGEHIAQKGSNITGERLRFDFSHPQKMTSDEIKAVEDLVNEQIQKDLPVLLEEMSLDEAKEKNATGVFESKYGDKVKVYSAGEFSREICGGPHAERTGELGKFVIKKEEASSAGVRRIKAVLE